MEYSVSFKNFRGIAFMVVVGFSVSVVTSTVVAAGAYKYRDIEKAKQDQQIVVKGYARHAIVSDLAVWKIMVHGEDQALEGAYEKIRHGTEELHKFLKANDFKPQEIMAKAITTETHYERDHRGYSTRTVTSRTLSRMFIVTSNDCKRVLDCTGKVTELIKKGVFLESHTPQFTVSNIGKIKIDILGKASADARRRAEVITQKAGCQISEVRHVRMGVLQITEPHSTRVSGYGIYDTSTIAKDAAVVVTVTFGVRTE